MARMVKLNILCVMLLVYACLSFASATTTQPTTQTTGPSTTVAASNCPPNCKNDNCSGTPLQCLDGCKEGFYGQDCSSICIQNCKSCKDNATCDTCKDGFFGELCVEKCNIECKTCSSSKENCKGHCKPRSYGDDCQSSCKTSCQECVSATNCTVCRTNTYNVNDVTTCACIFSECSNKNNTTRVCQSCVKDDWYAVESGCCKCGRNCVNLNCSELGHCVEGCVPGYYGDRCNLLCSSKDGNCSLCEGSEEKDYRCTTCSDGLYPHVDTSKCIPCSDTCNDSSTNVAKCDASTGKCKFGCEDRYLGDRCQLLCDSKCSQCEETDNRPVCTQCNTDFYLNPDDNTDCLPCSEHCKIGSSSGSKCSLTNGSCTAGCEAGYYGEQCKNECSSKCASEEGGLNPVCDRTNGECTKGCKPGYYGVKCKEECSSNCKSVNDGSNPICNKEDGECTHGCKPGYYGVKCKEECSPNCASANAGSNSTCNKEDGECTHGCKPGHYGTECQDECSLNCVGRLCNITTGTCSQGCNAGFGGPTCIVTCSAHCTGRTCYNNRTCTNGCEAGFFGSSCDDKCNVNCLNSLCRPGNGTCTVGCATKSYGDSCNKNCNENCKVETCFRNGTCDKGCKEGYSGVKCDQTNPSAVVGESDITWIAYVIAGVAVLGIVCTIVIVILKKRRKRRMADGLSKALDKHEDEEEFGLYRANVAGNRTTNMIIVNPAFGEETEKGKLCDPDPDVDSLTEDDREYVNTRRIPVGSLLSVLRAKGEDDYTSEFKDFPVGPTQPFDEALKKENLTKTVYEDVLPYDDSRVILRREGSTFINASYINGFSKQKWYIAAQAPNKNTLKDFWFMAWQEQVSTIVMMTNVCDEELSDGDKYWPELSASLVQGDITITGKSEHQNNVFVTRMFSVQKAGETRRVTQLQFLEWQNSYVPSTVIEIAEFHAKFRTVRAEGKDAEHGSPAIVHCSAGIGRTGVFVALDILYDEAIATKVVSIPDTVTSLRDQRVNMVQNIGQYVWLHKVLTQCVLLDCRPVQQTNFPTRYTQLSMTLDGDISMLQGSFKTVGSTLILDDRDLDSLKTNAALTRLNRPTADKIEDQYKPELRIENRKVDSDYINAVYVDGYTKKDKFIMTQFPMPETLNDFYRLVDQTKSSCIVVMETVDTKDRTQVQFIPKKGSSKTFGKMVVSVRAVDSQSSYDIIYMTLYKKGRLSTLRGFKEREVVVYQFKGWDNKSELPEEESDMLELVQAVNSRNVPAANAGPIIVTCLNGSKRSGMFVLLSVAMEKLVATNEVSMSSALRHIQSRRPGAVHNLDQYRFCHEVVTHYVTSLPSPEDLQPFLEPYN